MDRLADIDPASTRPRLRLIRRQLFLCLAAGCALGVSAVLSEELLGLDLRHFIDPVFGPHLLIVSLVVLTAVHEAGHVAGAKLPGIRISAVRSWPVHSDTEQGRWRVRLLAPWAIGQGFTKFAAGPALRSRARQFVAIGAGPLCSGLLALLCWWARRATSAGWLSDQLLNTAFWSGAIGILSLVPFRRGMFRSDGALLMMLAQGGDEWRRYDAMLRIMEMSANGTRPKCWPEELLQLARAAECPAEERSARALSYLRLRDCGQLDAAEAELAWLLRQRWIDPFEWRYQAALFAAYWRGDPRTARPWLESAVKSDPDRSRYDRWLAEAAIAVVENRREDAAPF